MISCCRLLVTGLIFIFAALVPSTLPAAVIEVASDGELRDALRGARAAATIRIAPGRYSGGLYIENLTGTADDPIVIEGADPKHPPVIEGGAVGMQLSDAAHVTLRHLVFRRQSGNGLNIDDGGSYDSPAHHIVIEHVTFESIGPVGNCDPLKLSGVNDFAVNECAFHGWGGSAIDMVGCHRGTITRCEFRGRDECSGGTGPQAKGGTSNISVRACRFSGPIKRGINLGGSTGLQYFRPPDVLTCEARDLTVEGCTFLEDVEAAVAFVGIDGATVRHNTIYRPTRWALRILQETTEPGFIPCRNGRFERNLIVFRRAQTNSPINIGPHTQPESFVFDGNWWYCEDSPKHSKPALPVAETDATHGIDPELARSASGELLPGHPDAADVGAGAAKK